MISGLLGSHFAQDGLLGLLAGFGGAWRASIHGLQEKQEIFNSSCKKQSFWSMAPRLLAGNSQKSCSRLSAVHISA